MIARELIKLHTPKGDGQGGSILFWREHLIPAFWTNARDQKLTLIRIKRWKRFLDQHLARLPSDEILEIYFDFIHRLALLARNRHD